MTAIEWLEKELKLDGYDHTIQQAKEMEKQQIEDAHIEGQRVFDKHPHTQWTNDQAEQYYNETYGSKGSDETKEYPHSHIYETIGGKYGLSSYNEYDQTDGIFNTYQEAVDFGLSLIKPTHTSSQTEISDEEIEDRAAEWMEEDWDVKTYYEAFIDGASWYREQLNNNLKLK